MLVIDCERTWKRHSVSFTLGVFILYSVSMLHVFFFFFLHHIDKTVVLILYIFYRNL